MTHQSSDGDHVATLIARGEDLRRAFRDAHDEGGRTFWRTYKRRRTEVVAWGNDVVRTLPSHVRAVETWATRPPPPSWGDPDLYLDERLALLHRIMGDAPSFDAPASRSDS